MLENEKFIILAVLIGYLGIIFMLNMYFGYEAIIAVLIVTVFIGVVQFTAYKLG